MDDGLKNSKMESFFPLTNLSFKGICPDSPQVAGYQVYNPYCDGTGGESERSKVWAVGARNPFRATVRTFLFPGEPYFGGPGTVYFGMLCYVMICYVLF